MDRRVTLIVLFWCLSHQQGRHLTLCRENRYVLAQCDADMTPFPGQLPPGWGRTCQAGPRCVTSLARSQWDRHSITEYQCDSETWNLTYLCLPADQSVDICQDVRQTREGNTSLVHGQLMASRGDNVICTCVVTRSPGQNNIGILVKLYTRHLVQPPDAEAASCQGTLTLRDTRKPGPTPCLLTTRPTGQYSSEVSLWPGYAPFLNDTTSLTITYELNGGATWGQDQLLPFALRLSGTGSYDVECGRLDDDVTESTGSYVPTTINAVLTNREFESTSTTGPTAITTVHTIRETTSVDNPGNSGSGIFICLSVALTLVAVLLLLAVGFLLRRRLTPGKPSHGEAYQNSMNMERQTRTTIANNNVQER